MTMISKTRTYITAFFLTAILTVLFMSGTAFAANKAARLRVTHSPMTENATDKLWNQNTYQLEVTMKSKDVLKEQNYESAKILIPKSLFEKKGDAIGFLLNMSACIKKDGEYVTKFYCQSGFWFYLEKTKKGKRVTLYDERDDKMRDASKYVSVDETDTYYILNFKNVPVCRIIYNVKTGENGPKWNPTSKAYYLTPVIFYQCSLMGPKGKGNIYLDQVSVKTTNKQTVTFNKVDYAKLIAFNLDVRKNMTIKRVEP